MSTVQINFLRIRRKEMTSLQKSDRKYAIILGYVTAGVAVAAGCLVAYQLFLTTQLSSTKKKETEVQRQIATLSSVELEYLTLGQKFNEIQTLMKGKSLRQGAIEFFTTLFAQQSITLSEVHFETDGVVRFQISSPNIFQLEQFMGVLQTQDVLSKYPAMTLSDLSREKSGMYNMAISVALPIVTPPPPQPKKTIKLPSNPLKK